MSDIHQFLKLLFGGVCCLMQLVLKAFDRFIQRTDALFQFLHSAADVLPTFIL